MVRKKESFKTLNNFYYKNYDDIYKYMKEIILNHNINKLSLFIQTKNEDEKRYFDYFDNTHAVRQLFETLNFEKGLKIFDVFFSYNINAGIGLF